MKNFEKILKDWSTTIKDTSKDRIFYLTKLVMSLKAVGLNKDHLQDIGTEVIKILHKSYDNETLDVLNKVRILEEINYCYHFISQNIPEIVSEMAEEESSVVYNDGYDQTKDSGDLLPEDVEYEDIMEEEQFLKNLGVIK